MTYSEWSPEHQDLWENMPVDYGTLTRNEYEWAEYLYEEAFMKNNTEAKEMFFALCGIDEGIFG